MGQFTNMKKGKKLLTGLVLLRSITVVFGQDLPRSVRAVVKKLHKKGADSDRA
jgi:hypothetical protein